MGNLRLIKRLAARPSAFRIWPLLFAAASMGLPLQATSFEFSTSIALDPSFFLAPNGYLQTLPGFSIVPLQAGDTLTGIVTFSNGSLSVSDPAGNGFQTLEFLDPGGPSANWSETILVLGLIGNLGNSNPSTSDFNGGGILSAEVFTSPFPTPQDFTFTGFSYTITVTSVLGQQTTAPFTTADIRAFAGSGGTVDINFDTPEPSSTALVLCGLLALLGLAAATSFRRAC
jgi:hypothetical protein